MIIMITNTIVPYCYDVAHILGLPASLSHRFRYRSRWMKLPTGTKVIKGQEGLIVLRNFDTGGLIPIRFVYIEEVLTIGDINYIEFRLCNYFPISHRLATSQVINDGLRDLGFENKENHSLECLVFEMDKKRIEAIEGQDDRDDIDKWSAILHEVGHLKCFKDFGFLRILRLSSAKESQALTKKDETGKFAFVLKPGRLYFLDVIQHVPWDIDKTESIESPYDVELKAETDEVCILRKIQRVVGKYDLLRFMFKTPSGYASKHTFLEVENRQAGEIAKYGLPALFLPLWVKPPTWMRVMRIIQVGLGVLAILIVLASDTLSCIINIKGDWIRTFALLVLVLVSKKWDDVVTEIVKGTKDIKL